jgi:RNA polymerase sigma factor (sigma-70 family)
MASASAGDIGRHLRQLFAGGSGVGLGDAQLLERFAAAARRGDRHAAGAAFETILARHGATVLSVCRQVLGDGHAAEDAFQATFLVLVRRAGSLRLREGGALGGWLHGVAYRTALKARRGAVRRREREQRVAGPEARPGSAAAAVEVADLGEALHAEVARLPAKYRSAVVLCYFEGRTHAEAAAALSWPVGTVRCRLSRARDLLRRRLAGRGLAPAAAALGAAGATAAARAEVPAPLCRATLDAAMSGAPAPPIAALVDVVLQGLIAARLRRAAAAALGLVTLAAGLVFAFRAAPASPSSPSPSPSQPKSSAPSPVVAGGPQPRPVDHLGDPLPAHARARLGTSAFHGGGSVNNPVFTRDGKTLITSGMNRVVDVWDAATGRLRHRMGLSGPPWQSTGLSPDGMTLAASDLDPDRRLRLWDVASGRELRRLHPGKDDWCEAPAFTSDGRTLITMGYREQATNQQSPWYFELWDLAAPNERRRRIVGNWGRLWKFRVSPDGKTLAAISTRVAGEWGAAAIRQGVPEGAMREDVIRVVDLATGKVRLTLGVEWLTVPSLAFAPDSRHLAASLSDGTIRVYDTVDGHERLPRLDTEPPVGPPPPRGRDPFSSDYFKGYPELIDSLTISPDGSILAGGTSLPARPSSPGFLGFWDFASGRELRRIEGFRAGPESFAFAPDGRTLAAVNDYEPIVRLWDVATGREVFPQPGHAGQVNALAVSPADGTVFTGSHDGTVRHWDPATGRELGPAVRHPSSSVYGLAISPDGQTLIVMGTFGDSIVWSVPERRELRRLKGLRMSGFVFELSFSPDGRTVAHERGVWDVATGRRVITLQSRDGPPGAQFSRAFHAPDGRRILTAEPGVIRAWDAASGAELAPVVRSADVRFHRAALSADGRLMATSGFFRITASDSADPWIRVWDVATGRQVAKVPAHEHSISGLAFSPDGRLLASFRPNQPFRPIPNERYPQDPTIRIWSVATGRELRRLEGHRGTVNDVVFTPDGRSVISAGEDATALVWDVSDLRE